MAKFTVDTHLFRELGELLVGRDSTALVELIKNAYDADATQVIVYGEMLEDLAHGYIQIIDDGMGMTFKQFEDGFLRIASRSKEQGGRVSKRHQRRYTGAKGIGRLAAHKIARIIEISSVPWGGDSSSQIEAIEARIDWDLIEKQETLDDLDKTSAVIVQSKSVPGNTSPGTVITLRGLRRRWTIAERGRFLTEIQTFEPPQILVEPLPRQITSWPLLIERLRVRDSATTDKKFQVILDGDFASGEDYWKVLAESASWIIEIDAQKDDKGKVQVKIIPTVAILKERPDATPAIFSLEHPDILNGPFFQSRILVREGVFKGAGARKRGEWARRSSGVRVFMEGFRVLPYGEPNNDWLRIDADYARRSRDLPFLPEVDQLTLFEDEVDTNEALNALRNSSYFGAVLLTEENAGSLRMLINREGFIPDASYDNLVKVVRGAIDLSVRVRAAANLDTRVERKRHRSEDNAQVAANRHEIGTKSSETLKEVIAKATEIVTEAKQLAVEGDFSSATELFVEAATRIEEIAQASDQIITERSMLRVLASTGAQMAAFIHEINGLLGMAQSIDAVIANLRNNSSFSTEQRTSLAQLQSAIGELRRGIERQAAYITDIVTPDARRRRVRQVLAERFEAGKKLVEQQAQKRNITIFNNIPQELRSPPMFPAELMTIFSNLLTNAVKSAGINGEILAHGYRNDNERVIVIIENTGVVVELQEAERWFRPFESTTTEVDPVLGQGMGLGLTITRSMLEEYGGEVRFITPSSHFSTAIEVSFPR